MNSHRTRRPAKVRLLRAASEEIKVVPAPASVAKFSLAYTSYGSGVDENHKKIIVELYMLWITALTGGNSSKIAPLVRLQPLNFERSLIASDQKPPDRRLQLIGDLQETRRRDRRRAAFVSG